jgi:hypothetical protein
LLTSHIKTKTKIVQAKIGKTPKRVKLRWRKFSSQTKIISTTKNEIVRITADRKTQGFPRYTISLENMFIRKQTETQPLGNK